VGGDHAAHRAGDHNRDGASMEIAVEVPGPLAGTEPRSGRDCPKSRDALMTLIGRLVFLLSFMLAMATGGTPAAAQPNPIQIENAHPGSTDWLLTRVMRHDDELYERGWRRRTGIEAYASHTSIKAGETLDVHVSTDPASQYTVSIYRMGYYGGAGARLMRSLGPLQGTVEPTPEDGDRHLVECRWTVGFRLEIPESWVHADADGLLRAKAFLSVGHDEYWTERMFENVTRARDAGVSLAFLSGNSISGVVELLPSTSSWGRRRMASGSPTGPATIRSTGSLRGRT
jgi:hypothetical protein